MGAIISNLSRLLGIPEGTLAREAADAWIFAKMAELDREIARLAAQYGARSPDDIERKIREGTIPGHPAWEDAIRWEGLEEFRLKLLGAFAREDSF
jgi:hypothetical protein